MKTASKKHEQESDCKIIIATGVKKKEKSQKIPNLRYCLSSNASAGDIISKLRYTYAVYCTIRGETDIRDTKYFISRKVR